MNKVFNWSLNESNFTWLDRIKLAKFFLTPKNRWTQSDVVQEFEREMAKFIGCKYAIFVSSGSTANTLLAYDLKDRVSPDKNVVVLPAVTWQTSCSPWIREGFTPHFIDISLNDLSMDLDLLERYLKDNASKVACVFITSLLGFSPDVERIKKIASYYGVEIMLDNCENTLGGYYGPKGEIVNVSNELVSTTSTYFGHQIQSVEGGFVFTNNLVQYSRLLMYRNHGMVRSLEGTTFTSVDPENLYNKNVDCRFDFFSLGNNFRNSNVHAKIGLLDLKRAGMYKQIRVSHYNFFVNYLDISRYWMPKIWDREHVPFALPIIANTNRVNKNILLGKCQDAGIETRPIISGNLLKQTCYKQFADWRDFPNATHVDENGFYVGLHSNVTIQNLKVLLNIINE